MGYCMDQRAADFTIKSENKGKALEAIKGLATQTKRMGGGSSRGERWFSWVTTKEFVEAGTLLEAISAWRWEANESENGDITDIYFHGEKLGDDTIFLEAIAPYVEAGSYIEMQGEDGSIWRWVFDGRGVVEQAAKIVWEN